MNNGKLLVFKLHFYINQLKSSAFKSPHTLGGFFFLRYYIVMLWLLFLRKKNFSSRKYRFLYKKLFVLTKFLSNFMISIQCFIIHIISVNTGEQLSNTRRSDPFFYTLLSDPMIRDIVDDYSGAKLMCHTTQLPSVPKNIFFVPSEK